MVPFDLINASFKILQAKCKVARIFNKFAADHFESLWTLNLLPCNVSDESALRAMKNNLWRCWFQVKFPEILKVCAVYVLDSTVYHGSKKIHVYTSQMLRLIYANLIYTVYIPYDANIYIYIYTRCMSFSWQVPQPNWGKVRIETVQPTVPPSAVGRRTVGHDMQAVNRQVWPEPLLMQEFLPVHDISCCTPKMTS